MGLVTVGKSCGVLGKQGQLEGVGSRGAAEQWCCGDCDGTGSHGLQELFQGWHFLGLVSVVTGGDRGAHG